MSGRCAREKRENGERRDEWKETPIAGAQEEEREGQAGLSLVAAG